MMHWRNKVIAARALRHVAPFAAPPSSPTLGHIGFVALSGPDPIRPTFSIV